MSEQTEKKGFHYAWVILIGCCCLGAGGMALTISLMGVYMVPASVGMGLTKTQFTLWSSALGITQLFSFPIWGQLMKKHLKLCMLVGVLCEIIGILGFTLVHSVLGVIIVGILLGIALPMTFFMPIPTLTSNWFAPKYRGTMLGIGMAFSGVGTFIWAPVFTAIMEATNYVTCYYVNALLAAILLLPWVFLFKFTPEEKGLKPYGWSAEDEAKKGVVVAKGGLSAAAAIKHPAFWLLIVAIAFAAIGMGFNNCQRPMAAEMLAGSDQAANAAMIGAWMISVAAAGNVIGKILYGIIADRAGLKITTGIFVVLFFLCFVIWLAFPGKLIPMYIGAFLLGTHNGIASVGLPRIANSLFGGYAYEKIWSRLSMASAIIGGFSGTIVTAIAAGFGTFVGIKYLAVGMILVVIVAIFAFAAMGFLGKVKWDHKDDEAADVKDVA